MDEIDHAQEERELFETFYRTLWEDEEREALRPIGWDDWMGKEE